MGLDFKRSASRTGMAALYVSLILTVACGRSKEAPGATGGAASGGGSVAGSTGSNGGSGGANAGGTSPGGSTGTGGEGGDPFGSYGACASGVQSGQACSTSDQPCRILACRACAESVWRESWLDFCSCGSDGLWRCTAIVPPVIGDCIFDLPLDCATAGQYFSDPECTTHPTCDGGL